MLRRPRLALFLSGLFFGGALDHLVFVALKSPTSHYGLRLEPSGQLAFATLDMTIAAVLYRFHVQWTPNVRECVTDHSACDVTGRPKRS
jgi:hypothetical protein